EETFQEIKKYLRVLVNYFKNAKPIEIQQLRDIGSSLENVRKQAHLMNLQIQKHDSNFNPPGLEKFIASMDQEGTNKAKDMVAKIEVRLFEYVTSELKQKYGDDKWWVESIPQNIRVDCSKRWEENKREGEVEKLLFLVDYVAICKQNWNIVKEVISLDKSDKEAKTANTNWIKDLNKIRNQVSHPVHGPLDKESVEDVIIIYNKVNDFFP
ncbi:MAG: Swt1 family HEPN domain-containing protein, partial [Rhodobacteraceae bacterium]|nr:Swt1 family HEPN domain-containing protein [Paracoccaceae bacterium]